MWFKKITRVIYIALRTYFALIGFFSTLGVIVLIFGLKHASSLKFATTSKKPSEPQELYLDLTGQIAEKEPSHNAALLNRLFGEEPALYLPNLRSKLRDAKIDSDITGLHLNLGGLSASTADLLELREILEDFAESEKPISAHTSNLSNDTLLLGSVADLGSFRLTPGGSVTLLGPSISQVYLGEAFKKIGVEMQVLRAGKYKNAFENLTRNEPSPESKEEYKELVSKLSAQLIQNIADGRHVREEEVASWFQTSLFTPSEAVALKIVDSLAWPQYSDDDTLTLEDYDGLESTKNKSGKKSKDKNKQTEDGIGFVEVTGEIHLDQGSSHRGDGIYPSQVVEELQSMQENEKVKSVVIRVSSPGGSATASEIICEEVKRLNDKKPVIISMGSYAASGGYYISTPAKKIFAQPATITGSIGVISLIPAMTTLKEKLGISFHTFSESDRLSLLNPGTRLTDEDRKLFENTIKDIYDLFKARVAKGRHLSIERVEELAQGRVYTGDMAKHLGLVDELGGLGDAFTAAKIEAGLSPDELYPVYRWEPQEISLAKCLKSPLHMRKCLQQGGATIQAVVKPKVGFEVTQFEKVKSFLFSKQNERVLARLPWIF